MNKVLEISKLDFSYHTLVGETKAVENISFDVYENEFLGIIGPSGSGKSTILSLIFGLLTPTTGQIRLHTAKTSATETDIGYMLQKDHLFEWRSIYKNITLGLEIRHLMSDTKKTLIDKMLNDYGLSGFKDAKPSQLSGGMRQRAALIRTLALEPKLLLLDEPFSALDSQTRLSVSEDIYTILRREHKSAVLVTHDISEAISFCDRVIILTKRPGTIKKLVPIHLTLKDKTPLKARSAPEFRNYFNELWGELHEEK